MQIRNTSNAILATVITFAFTEWNDQFKDSGWLDDDNVSPVGYNMTSYAGSTVRLYFRQDNLYDNLYETWVFVDDVSVVYRKFVDLAVDGNGDDLFGNTGTGAGGTSIRSREPGQTAAYLLDIENEGLDGDSYNLTVTPPVGLVRERPLQRRHVRLPLGDAGDSGRIEDTGGGARDGARRGSRSGATRRSSTRSRGRTRTATTACGSRRTSSPPSTASISRSTRTASA